MSHGTMASASCAYANLSAEDFRQCCPGAAHLAASAVQWLPGRRGVTVGNHKLDPATFERLQAISESGGKGEALGTTLCQLAAMRDLGLSNSVDARADSAIAAVLAVNSNSLRECDSQVRKLAHKAIELLMGWRLGSAPKMADCGEAAMHLIRWTGACWAASGGGRDPADGRKVLLNADSYRHMHDIVFSKSMIDALEYNRGAGWVAHAEAALKNGFLQFLLSLYTLDPSLGGKQWQYTDVDWAFACGTMALACSGMHPQDTMIRCPAYRDYMVLTLHELACCFGQMSYGRQRGTRGTRVVQASEASPQPRPKRPDAGAEVAGGEAERQRIDAALESARRLRQYDAACRCTDERDVVGELGDRTLGVLLAPRVKLMKLFQRAELVSAVPGADSKDHQVGWENAGIAAIAEDPEALRRWAAGIMSVFSAVKKPDMQWPDNVADDMGKLRLPYLHAWVCYERGETLQHAALAGEEAARAPN